MLRTRKPGAARSDSVVPRPAGRGQTFRAVAGGACLCAGLVIAVLGVTPSASAEATRKISWDDLLPAGLLALDDEARVLEQELAQLPNERKDIYYDVARELTVQKNLEDGFVTESELSTGDRQLLADKPSVAHPEALAYWKRVESVRERMESEGNSVDPKISGQRVRIPGYVLPLEFEGSEVKDFLLVPYVGACIHVPPPPANQMVFVQSEQSFESEGLYSPVWVEGTLKAESASHKLFYVDGQAPVDAGYRLEAIKIEAYKAQ